MSEGQDLSGYFQGLSLKIIMFKFEDNPFKNNKVTAKNIHNFNYLTFKVKVIYEWWSRSVWLFLRDIPEDYHV
jgi:hypothetical protein